MLIVVAMFVTICFIGYSYEAYQWNNGICRQSGKPWKKFDNDSQGAYGYTDGAGNYCWISWPFIIKK